MLGVYNYGNNRTKKAGKDLNRVLKKLRKDGIDITVEHDRSGDNYITILTKNWNAVLGTNELAVWIESQELINCGNVIL